MKSELDISMDTYLRGLRESPAFMLVVERRLMKGIPEIERYIHNREKDKWVYSTGLQDGYLLALRKLGLKLRLEHDRRIDHDANTGTSD